MKKPLILAISLCLLASLFGVSFLARAQDRAGAQRHEFAVIKWDGADKVCVNLPEKSEIAHVFELSRTRTPREMQDEEFCLAWMANHMAKDGWEVIAFDSRRLVFRRTPTGR